MTERSTPRPSTTDDSGVVLARRVVVGRTRLSNRVSAGNLWLRCVQGAERGFERSFGDGGKDSCLPLDWIDIGPVAVRGHEGTAAVDGRLDPISIDVPDRRPDCSEDGSCWFVLGDSGFDRHWTSYCPMGRSPGASRSMWTTKFVAGRGHEFAICAHQHSGSVDGDVPLRAAGGREDRCGVGTDGCAVLRSVR